MSRNNYSIRDRNRRETSGEIQSEKARLAGVATPNSLANASSVIYLGNIPNDWNEQIVSSVVAGSGKVVDIRSRIDPQGRGKNFCFVEYLNPHEAAIALQLLSEIKLGPKRKLRVELSKEGLRTTHPINRPVLELNKNFLPYYVQIPAGMRDSSSEPPQMGFPNQGNNTPMGYNSSVTPVPQPGIHQLPPPPFQQQVKQEPMPEVLAKASQYLPQFNPSAFRADDKVSQNLQHIPPVQLIEFISTLKQLAATNVASAQQAFDMSPNLAITMVQSMILMGLIDINTLTAAIQQQAQTSQPSSAVPTPPPPIHSQLAPQPDPRWPNLSARTGEKLAKLDPNEASMIAQVLTLPPDSIGGLPPQQRQMVESIRAQYL